MRARRSHLCRYFIDSRQLCRSSGLTESWRQAKTREFSRAYRNSGQHESCFAAPRAALPTHAAVGTPAATRHREAVGARVPYADSAAIHSTISDLSARPGARASLRRVAQGIQEQARIRRGFDSPVRLQSVVARAVRDLNSSVRPAASKHRSPATAHHPARLAILCALQISS